MRNDAWSIEEIDFLKSNYHHMTNNELAKSLSRSKTAIDLKLNRLGIKKSKYRYDHSFFNIIDTEDKAYWLGFIFADGCITFKNENPVCYELSIELNSIDKNHLKKFNKSINGNIDIKSRVRPNPFNHGSDVNMSFIRIYSRKLVESLVNLGAIQNKTKSIRIPNISDDLIRHFIRGYYDGDGCICKSNNKRRTFSCNFTSGCKNFIYDIRKVLYANGINSYVVEERESTYRLYINGMKNCCEFLNFIYTDSIIFLDRKFKKASKLLEDNNYARRLPLQPEMVGFF